MDRLVTIIFLIGLSGVTVFGELSEGSQKYHQLILKKPQSELVFERFLQAWLTTGDRESLETWLQEEAKNGSVADWQVLATYYEDAGESGEALAALDQAAKLDGGNLVVKLARAKLLAKRMDFVGALEDLKPVAKDAKLRREAMNLQGIYLVRVGRPGDAVRTWGELVKLFPGDEGLREDLIEVAISEGLYEEAIESLLSLISGTKDPYQKALRQIRLAEAYTLADRSGDSLSTYEKVMAASGEGTWLEREVLSQIEQIYVWRDDVQGLRDYYQKLREDYPRRTSIRKALAKQMAKNSELEEAIALFREVLKITPGDVGNREEFVAFLELNELWKEASVELEELIKQKGDDHLLWERIVVLKHELKDLEGLRSGLEKLRGLKGNTPEGLVSVAARYEQFEMGEDAEAILREGWKRFPESRSVAEALAKALMKTGRRDEARDIWLSVAESGERDDVLRSVNSLTRNGMKEEGFGLLLKNVRKSPEDHLLVAPLGSLALTPEQAVEATPFLLEMSKRATTPTALEASVTLAIKVVLRSEREVEVAARLERENELSIVERCLLAELHLAMGDRMKARDLFEGGGDDRLINYFRVRFEEREGDLAAAITLMEKILEKPGERKAVQLRRLMALYQRAGRLTEALKRADEWKKVSPGNVQAWLNKAQILTDAGHQDKAVAEYRRILGRFGATEESRSKLAAALEEQRDYVGAGKVYRKLFETAKEQQDQLKWVVKWAEVMNQIRRGGEVVEALEARKKSNRKSARPLLALAEVYGVLGENEKRRDALVEAVRRKPGGWEILLDLAKESENAGDFETAVKILKEAILLEEGGDSKRALAELFLRNGEIEKGVALIKSIPGDGDDPRQVEKTVEFFARLGNWEVAEKYLTEVLPSHAGDWRLEYLRGLLYLQKDDRGKALEVMNSLDRAVQPLAGVAPAKQPQSRPGYRTLFHPSGRFSNLKIIEIEQIYYRCLMPIGQNERDPFLNGYGVSSGSYRGGRYSSASPRPSIFSLPDSPEELQKRVFVRRAILLSGRVDDAGRSAFEELIAGADFDQKIFILQNLRADRYREFLLSQIEARPNDPRIAWLWLRASQGNDEQREVTRRAFTLLRKEVPLDLLSNFPYYYGKMDSYQNGGFASLSELFHGLSDDEKKKVFPYLIQTFGYQNDPFSSFGVIPHEEYKKEWDLIEAEVLEIDSPTQSGEFYHAVIARYLSEGRGEEAARLINRCVEWTVERGLAAGGQSNQYQRRSQVGLRPIEMRGYAVGDYVGLFSLIYPEGKKTVVSEEEKKRQFALLEKLEMADSATLFALFPGDVLAPHVHHIKHPVYRGLILNLLNRKEELEKLVSEMSGSKDPSQIRFAAAYYSENQEFRKAYQNLLKLSNFQLNRAERSELDGNLAFTANQLSGAELKEVDLAPAREALMRVQRKISGGNWQEIMRKLGLHDEVDRLDRIAKSKVRQNQVPSRTSRRRPVLQGKNLIAKELTEDAPEKAIAEMKRLVRRYRGGPNQYGDWSENLAQFEEASQISQLLEELKPKGRAGVRDWFLYGGIASQTTKKDEAKDAFKKVLEMQPDHHFARLELFLLSAGDERDWSIFSMKENPDSAASLVAVFYEKYSRRSSKSYDQMIDTCRAARFFLESHSELDPRKGINEWLTRFCGRAENHYQFDGFEISPLNGTRKGDESKWDQERSDLRVVEFRKLFEEMLNHGLHADSGFRGLLVARKVMGLTDEELLHYANLAYAKVVEKPGQEGVEFSVDPFLMSRGDSLTSRAASHLLESCEGRKGEVFTDETLKAMAEHRPESYRLYQYALRILKAPLSGKRKLYAEMADEFSKQELGSWNPWVPLNRLLTALEVEDGEWASLHEEKLVEMISVQKSYPSVVVDWGLWVFKKRRAKGFYEWVSKVCESALGDRERWPILAELSAEFRPLSENRKLTLCEGFLKSLHEDPRLTIHTAAAVKKEGLFQLLPSFGREFRKRWADQRPSNSENYFNWLKVYGGVALAPDGSRPDAFRMLVFTDLLSRSKVPLKDDLDGLNRKLNEEKGIDPLMRDLLKLHWGLAVDFPDFIDKNLKVFLEMEREEPIEVAVFFGKWMPALEGAELSEASAAFVARVTGKMGSRALDFVTRAVNRAGGAEAYLKDSGSYQSLADLIPLAPVEIAGAFGDLVEQALGERAEKGVRLRDSISPEKYVQQRLSSIVQLLNNSSSSGSSLVKWKFLNALFHGFYRDHEDAIFTNRGQMTRVLAAMIRGEKDLVRAQGNTPGTSLKVLQPVLQKMTVEERKSMLLFLPNSGELDWRAYPASSFRADFEWVDQELRKDFPACADFWTAMMSRGIDGKSGEQFANEMTRGSENFLRFLKESQFPGSLEVAVIRRIFGDSGLRRHLKTPEHWEWIGRALSRAQFAKDVVKSSGSIRFLTYLRPDDIESIDLIPPVLVLAMMKYTQDDWKALIDQRDYEKIFGNTMLLAARSGDRKSVTSLMENSPGFLESHLALQWRIFKTRCGDLLPGKLDVKKASMNRADLPLIGRNSEEEIQKFVAIFPEDYRFHLERLFLSARDQRGEDAPENSYEERTPMLARRYVTEGGGPREFVLSDLAFFASDERTFPILAEHFVAQEENNLLGVRGEDSMDDVRMTQLRQVIRAAVVIEAEKGNFEPARRQFLSILGQRSTDRYNLQFLENLFSTVAYEVLRISIAEPERAGEFVDLTDELFKGVLRLPNFQSSSLTLKADAFSSLQRLLANQSADENAGYRLWKEYQEFRGNHPLTYWSQATVGSKWSSDDGKKILNHLQVKILTSESFLRVVNAHPGLGGKFYQGQALVRGKALKELMEGLPKETLEEPFFIWKTGLFANVPEDALELLSKARSAAKDAEFAEMEIEIMIDMITKLRQLKRDEEARKMAKAIDPKLGRRGPRWKQIESFLSEK